MGDGAQFEFFNFYATCFILTPIGLVTLKYCSNALSDYLSLRRREYALKFGLLIALLMGQVALGRIVWNADNATSMRHTAPMECMSNLKMIGLGILEYEQDYDNKTPPASMWADAVKPYATRANFHCPMSPTPYGYAVNDNLGARDVGKVREPSITVDIFETDLNSPNSHGTATNVVPNRHWSWKSEDNYGSNYAFADGHVKMLPSSGLSTLNWTLLAADRHASHVRLKPDVNQKLEQGHGR